MNDLKPILIELDRLITIMRVLRREISAMVKDDIRDNDTIVKSDFFNIYNN